MNNFFIFVTERDPIQEIRRNFRGRGLEGSYSVTLESNEISSKAELPFRKIQVHAETKVLDVIKECKNLDSFDLFPCTRDIEWIIEYGYILKRPQAPQTSDDSNSKKNKFLVGKYYQQKIKDLGILNNEVLILDTIEVSRRHTGTHVLHCMHFPPTVVDFLNMVNEFPLVGKSILQMALLYTDADKELSCFLRQSYSDIHILSGANFKVYAIEKVNTYNDFQESLAYWRSSLSEKLYVVWSSLGWLRTKPYDKAQCYEIGKHLGIRADQFPCLALFDIPHPNRVLIFPIVKPYIAFFRSLFSGLNQIIQQFEGNQSSDTYKLISQEYEKFRENLLENSVVETSEDRARYIFRETTFFVNYHTEENTMTENYVNNLQGANIANMANTVRDNARQQANQNIHLSEQKKTLAEAADEIQQLLKQLETTNPNATESDKIAYVNDEMTPSFKRRVLGALQAGSETAIEEFLDNPYVNVSKAIVKGWLRPE